MSAPFLTTKLNIPPRQPNRVPRLRLIERLDAGLHGKLTLISAPAGFGKTTLLSEWIRAGVGSRKYKVGREENRVNTRSTPYSSPPNSSFAWIGLDEGDNDWVRFLTYVIAALQTIDESIGAGILSALQSPRPPPVEDLLTTLINQISIISDHFLLVLDDYHLITAQPLHDALTFLLDRLPAISYHDGHHRGMHLVIATRVDPPLPLARLRGQGQLNELREADLRFTPDEAAEFLKHVTGLNLPAADIGALASRTEGWITGLQLAALSMRGQDAANIAGFIHNFTGSNRYVLDYLVEEVLTGLPDGIHSFLLKTSVLDRLTAPLCDAVLDDDQSRETKGAMPSSPIVRRSSASMLEHLERSNLFVVPLDEQREWYRYHRLFAELLRKQLKEQVGADGVALFRSRASAWYEAHGFIDAAINHSLAAEEFERAADLIEEAAETTLMRSEIATFLNWVEELPDALVHARPRLCVLHAGALMLSGHSLDLIDSRLQDTMENDLTGELAGEATTLRALMATLTGDAYHSINLSQQALELLSNQSPWRGILTDNLGMAYVLSGDIDAATHTFEEAARIGQETGDVFSSVAALCNLAGLCVARGQLRRAAAIYQRALELSTDQQGRQLPIAGKALLGLGELSREWNDLEAATRHLTRSIKLTKLYGEIGVILGYITMARVMQAKGDADGAWGMIHEAKQIAYKVDMTEMDDIIVAACQARFWISQGNIQAARRWVEERELRAKEMREAATSSHEVRELEHVIMARLYLAQAQPDEALEVLRPLQMAAERWGRARKMIEILTLQALAHQQRGNTEDALMALKHALSLAEPEGYVRVFVDEGEPLAGLLQQAASRGIAPDYVSKLLSVFGTEVQQSRGAGKGGEDLVAFSRSHLSPSASPLIEPLSERELEILKLLTTHLSSTEIAEQLCISANTVRFHIKNIYSKLQVHRRSDAIHRADELGLL